MTQKEENDGSQYVYHLSVANLALGLFIQLGGSRGSLRYFVIVAFLDNSVVF